MTQLTADQIAEAYRIVAEIEAREKSNQRLLAALKAKDDLITFTRLMMPFPDDPLDVAKSRYQAAQHHKVIAAALEEVEAGRILRLILTLPPRHGKSELATKKFPAWFLGRDPYRSMIIATYGEEFALEFGREVREMMRSEAYQEVFPDVRLRPGSASSDRLQTSAGGIAAFVGRGGSLTGRGADALLIDDPIKDDVEAQSPTTRDKVWHWYNRVAKTRLMTAGGRVIIIATRWHEDDLIGRIIDENNTFYDPEEAKQWKIIDLPALALANDHLGRKEGEALWPERFTREFLENARRADPRGFSALYQGRPSPEEGDFFKAEYVVPYRPNQLPANLRYYVSSDHAVSIEQGRDKTCIIVAGVDDQGNIWIVDAWWRQAPTNVVVEAMLTIIKRWRPMFWYAERGHISKSIGPFLRKRMIEEQAFCSIIEQTPVQDKQTRAQSIQGRMSMGMVRFPSFAPWYAAARDELLKFPNATHDDFPDALAHLGLGLASQIKAKRPNVAVDPTPKVGTIGWVKWAHTQEQRERQLNLASGGF